MGSVCILAELFATAARFFTWNSRGLLSSNPERFKSKWALILNILPKVDIFLIQETHGSLEQATVAMAAIEHLFCWWFSPGPVERAGGLLTLVRRSGRAKVTGESFHEIVQGRCHAVELVIKDSSSLTGGSLVIGNIHNDRLSLHEANAVSAFFERHVRRSQRKGPRFLTCLGGDWNFLEPGAVPLSIERLPLSARAEMPSPSRRLQKALSDMILIQSDLPSHFNVRLKSFSSFDRWYFGIPAWFIKNTCVQASLSIDPFQLAKDGVSDHAPVGVLFFSTHIHT